MENINPIEFIPYNAIESVINNLFNIALFEELKDVDSYDVLEIYYNVTLKMNQKKILSDPSMTRIKTIVTTEKFYYSQNGTFSTCNLLQYLETLYIKYNKLIIIYCNTRDYYRLIKTYKTNMLCIRKLQ